MTGNVLEYFAFSDHGHGRLVRRERPIDDLEQLMAEIESTSALPLVITHAQKTPPKTRVQAWYSVFSWLASPKSPVTAPKPTFKHVGAIFSATAKSFKPKAFGSKVYDIKLRPAAWRSALQTTQKESVIVLASQELELLRAEHHVLIERVAAELREQVRAAEAAESALWLEVMAKIDAPSTDDGDESDAAAFQRTVARRDWLIAHERWLTSEDIALGARGGVVESNKDQYAYQLRQSGQVLGVRHQRKRLHPACQFREVEGRLEPLPIMKSLLEVLPADASGWDQALWLFQPTGRLDGARPADVLATRPEDVLDAAKKDFHGDQGI